MQIQLCILSLGLRLAFFIMILPLSIRWLNCILFITRMSISDGIKDKHGVTKVSMLVWKPLWYLKHRQVLTDNLTTWSKDVFVVVWERKKATPKVKTSQWSDTEFQNFNHCYFRYSFSRSMTTVNSQQAQSSRKRSSGSNHLGYFIQQPAGPRWRITPFKERFR